MQVSQYTPDAFPLGDNRRLLAPFWADVDTRNGGDVFYRETTDPNLLQQASNDVTATFVDQRKFKATWLFIATWYEVAFYGASGINTNKVRNSSRSYQQLGYYNLNVVKIAGYGPIKRERNQEKSIIVDKTHSGLCKYRIPDWVRMVERKRSGSAVTRHDPRTSTFRRF